jgi:DNA-3-methyladenine glycosylase
MGQGNLLTFEFYNRPVTLVARELLGMRLVRNLEGQLVSGIITETEAYDGMQDLACHARVGKTNRNSVMFGPAGQTYVYFTYGMHWCLNVVTGEIDYPAAVLIRAIDPQEGQSVIANNRPNVAVKNWTNGPAKLTKALQIDRMQNGIDITTSKNHLWIEKGSKVAEDRVKTGARIGLSKTPEPWRSIPWRFWFDSSEDDEKAVTS